MMLIVVIINVIQDLEEPGEDNSKYDVIVPTVVQPRRPDISNDLADYEGPQVGLRSFFYLIKCWSLGKHIAVFIIYFHKQQILLFHV